MSKFLAFGPNTVGRDYAVGDIHGCFYKLSDKLDEIGFNPEKDRLFSVGDLVDRGPQSELAEKWVQAPWFHAVKGNHDDMAERWPEGNMDGAIYVRNGGAWNVARSMEEQMETASIFRCLPLAIQVDTPHGLVGLVHAECPFDNWAEFRQALVHFDEAPRVARDALEGYAMWARERVTNQTTTLVEGVRAVIVGHTPLKEPLTLGNHIYIDTGAVFGRDFTILDLETLQPV